MKKNFKIGLKLWSTNVNLIPRVKELSEKSTITHLEIHAVHGSFEKTISKWSTLSLPFIVHAPNESVLDISDPSKFINNHEIFSEAQHFADELNSSLIIIHPSHGDIRENIRQILAFADNRICIENMPYYSLHNNQILNGSSYKELVTLLSKTKSTFCLDIGHAIVAAHNLKIGYLEHVKDLLELRPAIFHLNDGFMDAINDNHLHLGNGDFPLREITDLIPDRSIISLETPKNIDGDLSDFVGDIKYLTSLLE